MRSEHGWLRTLGPVIGAPSSAVQVGIGDDAAALSAPAGELIATVDACVEGVHFTRAIASLEDVGYRSFMAAASDLAAMAARPLAALSAVTLPPTLRDDELDALVAGQRLASLALALPLVGGNLARAPLLSVTTTALGQAARPVLRSGARPGQRLWLAGPVGLAAAGLRALLAALAPSSPALAEAVAAWRRPRARLADGLAAAAHGASALIDVSDGLAQDAAHVARASGARLVLDAEAIVQVSGDSLREAARALGADPFALALAGGEDYALLAASDGPLPGFACVGEVTAGAAEVVVVRGGEVWVPPAGFDHGAG